MTKENFLFRFSLAIIAITFALIGYRIDYEFRVLATKEAIREMMREYETTKR